MAPITRREVVGGLALTAAVAASPPAATAIRPTPGPLSSDLAQMLMLGFVGDVASTPSAAILADYIAAGHVGGVFFVKANVGSREDVQTLTAKFSGNKALQPLIAIDHEGGAVQRLVERHGFTRLLSARRVAATMPAEEAKQLYAAAAQELAAIGFNVNLGPVVDLDDPSSPAVGHFERAFDANPAKVATYAKAFIDGFASARILCALKHFPGEGLSQVDSHKGLADITATWSEKELLPYSRLIAAGDARMIMSGHVRLASLEEEPIPVTLSFAVTTGLLRRRLGFDGVVMTDALDMTAVTSSIDRRQAVIRSIGAGNDILMMRNDAPFDPSLPQNVAKWVQQAIDDGELSESRIRDSAERVRRLKQRFFAPSPNEVR
jgi:beta-N-acetylhexosaminidase